MPLQFFVFNKKYRNLGDGAKKFSAQITCQNLKKNDQTPEFTMEPLLDQVENFLVLHFIVLALFLE